MPIPVEVNALEGEQYNAYSFTAQQQPTYPLGTLMRMQDGRWYRYARCGAATLTVGDVLQSPANVALHNGRPATAAAVGVRSPSVTLGATAAVLNQYAGGYLVVEGNPGAGELYAVKDHAAIAPSGAGLINLDNGHAIRTALTSGSTVSLLANPYNGVIQNPVAQTGAPVAVAVKALTNGQYGWVQTKGCAQVQMSTAALVGQRAVALAAAAGSAGLAASVVTAEVGRVQLPSIGGAGTYVTIQLCLE